MPSLRVFLCICVCFLLCTEWRRASAVITVAPVSVAALLDTSVNFTCEGTGYWLTWIVESGLLTDAIMQQRDITITDNHSGNNLSSVLTITALPVNDRVGIGCQIICSFDPFHESFSDEAILTVMGVSQVEDIQWSPSSQHLSWSPPSFYSDDIPREAITTYHLTVETQNDTSSFSTTSRNMLLSSPLCTLFNVSINASIVQYVSEMRDYRGAYGNHTISIENHSIIFNATENNFEVKFITLVSCTSCMYNNAIVGRTISSENRVRRYNRDDIGELQDGEGKTIVYSVTGLEAHERFIAEIEVLNFLNNSERQANDTFTTYHVQGLIINEGSSDYTNGSVRVKCLFVEGSTADGCHVLFNDTAQGKKESFNITGTVEEIVTLSVSGNYTVTAYDLVNGTIIGPSVKYSTPVEIISLAPSSPMLTSTSISSSVLPFPITTGPPIGFASSGSTCIRNSILVWLVVIVTVISIRFWN